MLRALCSEINKAKRGRLCFQRRAHDIFHPNILFCNAAFPLSHQESIENPFLLCLTLWPAWTNNIRWESPCNFEGLALRYLQFPPSRLGEMLLGPQIPCWEEAQPSAERDPCGKGRTSGESRNQDPRHMVPMEVFKPDPSHWSHLAEASDMVEQWQAFHDVCLPGCSTHRTMNK